MDFTRRTLEEPLGTDIDPPYLSRWLRFSPFILPVESGSQNFKLEKYIFPSLEKKNGQNWEIRIYTQKKQYKQNKPLKMKNMTFNHYFNNIG